jgi:hypothetical protein
MCWLSNGLMFDVPQKGYSRHTSFSLNEMSWDLFYSSNVSLIKLSNCPSRYPRKRRIICGAIIANANHSSCILSAQCSEFLDCPFLITPSVFSEVYIMVPVNHTRLLFKIIIIPAYRLHLKKEMIGICNDTRRSHSMKCLGIYFIPVMLV